MVALEAPAVGLARGVLAAALEAARVAELEVALEAARAAPEAAALLRQKARPWGLRRLRCRRVTRFGRRNRR